MKHRLPFAVALALSLAACGGGATGTLTIDDRPAQIQDCASGEHERVPNAVTLTTDRGTFRFTRTDDGRTEISYLVSGLATPGGIPIPLQRRNVIANCGPMTLTREDYMQGGVYPLSGSATVDCNNLTSPDPDPHSFRGTITFDRCR